MKVTLQPISHAPMREIIIRDTLVSVGRGGEPFASLKDQSDVSRLSRRHAHIFREQEGFYIVDYGSRNGTRVNNWQVGKSPVALKPDDRVTFAEVFSFVVVADALQHSPFLHDVILMLTPLHDNKFVQPIVVSHFPFLITRVNSVFDRYEKRFPVNLQRISRRHALITLEGESVLLKDLNSNNGTFVGGEQLGEEPRVLENDDEIVFGSELFRYSVDLVKTNLDAFEGPGARSGARYGGADQTSMGKPR